MTRLVLVLAACAALSACGLAETSATAAAGGASEAQQAKEGLKTEQRVKDQVNAAVELDRQRRQAAETEAQQ